MYKFIWALPFLLGWVLQSCVDPTVPEYDYKTGFYVVEGRILNESGTSTVSVKRSELSFGNYRLQAVGNAIVSSLDGDGNEVVWLPTGEAGSYRAAPAFVAVPGQSYRVRVYTPEGQVIESDPEVMPVDVAVDTLRMTIDREAYFSTDRNRFVPAFNLVVDLKNTPGQDNFFQFQYRSWSQAPICATCEGGVYRNGICIPQSGVIYYDYACDRRCWSIDQGVGINLVSDELNSSGRFEGLNAVQFPYTGSGGILVELQQTAISREAYLYYGKLEDLTEGSSGLNAPLPAALYGNLANVTDPSQNVLGYVSVGAVSKRRLYWNRDTVPVEPLYRRRPIVYEPADRPITAPCSGSSLTPIKPEDWPN